MRVRRRRVTIEIDQYTLRVEGNVCNGPEDSATIEHVDGSTHIPPRVSLLTEDKQKNPLLPEEKL